MKAFCQKKQATLTRGLLFSFKSDYNVKTPIYL